MLLEEEYDPDLYEGTIQSLMCDENYCWLRSMVCLQIANVIQDEEDCDKRGQEMWVINSPKHEPVGIYCTPSEWDEVKKSFEQVQECGWVACMAQWAQDAHAAL